MRFRSRALGSIGIAALAISLSACGQGVAQSAGSGDDPTVGVLFPDNKTPQWENRMWPGVRDSLSAECPDCKVIYANVASDAADQQTQAESMLAQGIDVLILAPVSADASKAIVAKADAQNVPVIGFGSVPEGNIAGYVGVDTVELGRLQGEALLAQVSEGGDPKRGCVVALNGDAQTPGTQEFIEGRAETLDPFVDICKESFVTNWDPATAQTAMDQAITAIGKDGIVGVYTMNDGIASGAIAAMKNAGFATPFLPLGGQDSDLAAIQRILVGEQSFTTNARAKDWGETAGPVALQAARGEKLEADQTVTNGSTTAPWFTTPAPFTVSKENIQESILENGFFTYDELCTADYKSACDAAGLTPAAG